MLSLMYSCIPMGHRRCKYCSVHWSLHLLICDDAQRRPIRVRYNARCRCDYSAIILAGCQSMYVHWNITMEDFPFCAVVTFFLIIYLFTTTATLYYKIYNRCKSAIAFTVKDKNDEAKNVAPRNRQKETFIKEPTKKEQETLTMLHVKAMYNDTKSNQKEVNASKNDEQWRCVCETGFLPPGLLKSFGGMESVIRMSTGQCYHKTT
mmetsp:Transcript_13222/g.24829  ORF Transcript_13222/g.24829 Transcript_13222/m.24829 type:complete len:206 (+) Transcript_13222:24-641(+)